jgi:hypothetical protein
VAKKKNPPSKLSSPTIKIGVAALAVVVVAATTIAVVVATQSQKPKQTVQGEMMTSTVQFPTSTFPDVTPASTKTKVPTATWTATPSYSIFGKWEIDPASMGVLLSQPSSGQICNPDLGYWPSPIIIREAGDPMHVIVEGLYEHLPTITLPINLENMSISDTQSINAINESSTMLLALQADGRLYYEEQDYHAGVLYCQVYIYYVNTGN